jgi:cell division septum initiation protein DivIVA
MAEEPIHIPVEISRPPTVFDLVVRGYDRRQVDEHVTRLEQELAELAWRRDVLEAERQQVRAGREQLERERAEWERTKQDWQPSFSALGDRVSQILAMSQTEAEQLRTRTIRECAEERRKLEQELAAAKETAARHSAQSKAALRRELEAMRRAAEVDSAQIVHNARSEADAMLEAARRDVDGIRIRALELLASARQQRTKVALQLTEVTERVAAAQQLLAEAGEPAGTGESADGEAAPPPRIVVQIDAMED